MTFEMDWAYLRRNMLLPLVSAIMSLATLLATSMFHDSQQNSHLRFSANQSAVHEDYAALVYRRRLVDRYHRRYNALRDLGFVGEERRLDWLETLRVTTEDLVLPRVNYAIEPQLQVIAPTDSILADGQVQIRLSHLRLEMGLLHEVDLLRFIDQIQEQAPGLIKIDACSLIRNNVGSVLKANQVNLQATCSLQIFSVVTSDVIDKDAQS